ncbi:MAG: NAD-dependent epimerase/dehydratase family protein, partial [Verrucomicrobiaceae bacterium]|nr:NAD-dependent epimerase/dehydratase family protein [Verrucomicrobiaceae bacterium]
MESKATSSSRVVIAGGTGFLGLNLADHLVGIGHEVVLISRNAPAKKGPWLHDEWDGRSVGDWARYLEGASALVNLAGRTVDCIKTPDHCDEILRSRVESVQALGQALQNIK